MGNSPTKNNEAGFHENVTTKTKGKVEKTYELGEKVGRGSTTHIQVVRTKYSSSSTSSKNQRHGRANKEYEKKNSRPYAMKLYDGNSANKPNMIEEATILRKLDHPNIVKLYATHARKPSVMDLTNMKKEVSLILELCHGKDLTSRYPYTEERCSSILRQLLSAVAYLHKKNIIHRDINVTNILFESEADDSEIKLVDFGCATELLNRDGKIQYLKEKTGNIYIMAPEVIKGRYSNRADMWSVGVVAYMLIQGGKRPFDGSTIPEIERRILSCVYSLNKWQMSKKTVNFVEHLLIESPYRSNAEEALDHEWIVQSEPKVKLSNELISSFQLYSRYRPIKRMALNILAKNADTEIFGEYRKLFRDLDHTNRMGTLTKEDFKKGFSSKRSGFSEEELDELFTKLDLNCTGTIRLTEFLAATMETQAITEEDLLLTFDTLDEDKTGKITKKNLFKVLGSNASEEVTKEIEEIWANRPNLNYQEFKDLFGFISHNIDSITEASHPFSMKEEEGEED